MNKVLTINKEAGTAQIGKPDGSVLEVYLSEFNYKNPCVGDVVALYSTEGGWIIALDSTIPAGNGKPKKRVNKIVYVLLALLFGGLGLHKFYAGKIVQGVLYLLFCWTFIPVIIALIDAIVGLVKESDENGNYI